MKKYRAIILLLIFINIAPMASGFVVKGPDKTLDVPAYRIRGTEYLPLTLICDAYEIDWKWDATLKTVELSKGAARLRLTVDEYRVYVNGGISVQERPVIFQKGAVCVPSDFLRTIFSKCFLAACPAPCAQTIQAAPRYTIKKIVLDAGHGGYDPGAIGRKGIKEKYITLDIIKKIKDLLEAEGIEVILTRSDDRFIPLWSRADVSNNANTDLFVSIHANASRTRQLKGFEVYYLSEAIDDNERAQIASKNYAVKADRESIYGESGTLDDILWDIELTENRRNSIELANCILGEVDAEKERLKSARFYVLKGVVAPAVLVEVGYITNADDFARLGTPEYRAKIAGQITKGILDYKKKFESSDGFTD